ncbi:hypothetical protein GCM10010315_18660 [Streptomyces luteosporeus]|uniref:Uncharacterized protein n=1 Tax=Streptomyces luteosporeus TaxID=173856 RepID=A0ABN3TRU9_9ACTN
MVQKPSVRPGRPSRERPTGAPQSLRLQNRLRSGTSGSLSTAARGSGRGTPGMVTRPAPSRPRPEEDAAERRLRTETERAAVGVLCEPSCNERDRRPETDRREEEERAEEDPEDEPEDEPEEDPEDEDPSRALVTPVGGEERAPPGATTGASPQVSQYSSPAPTSSYVPGQPGRWQPVPVIAPPCGPSSP